jgi:lysophospholipase L1-like esterase
MEFRTELHIPENTPKISLQTPVLTVGSCFAEVIGNRLTDNKIPTLVNPFGTIFNPLSMAKLIRLAMDNQPPDADLYTEHQGVWFHYDFHSSLWGPTKAALNEKLIQKMQEVSEWLRKTNFLIFTFGTSFVYRHLATDQIVANCHKMPGNLFRKELLSVDMILHEFKNLFQLIDNRQCKLDIILTVSPVRHTKDTLPLNAVSKSILRLACHELCESKPDLRYFPAYELLLDDLRDYRFYKPDLIHPNETAEAYIFEKFAAACFEPALQQFLAEWKNIRAALAHRPLQPYTYAHRKFLEKLLEKLQKLAQKADISAETTLVQQQLNELQSHL